MATVRSTEASALERSLAYALVALVVASVISFIAIIVGTMNGLAREDFAEGIWPLATVMPYIGLPLAFVLLITLVLIGGRRRARANSRTTGKR